MAEGAFRRTVQQLGFKNKFRRIDSCGTASYHSGERPDPRKDLSFLFEYHNRENSAT